ncbi:uncharacterized protein LOC129310037 isoform X2 [Prosopis cineraria]|uniref:uncharacterized protein LOC129310037 isoform X2 n=1 Tax=Prosopis cineraria TaxID=364024 RepID=UPI00240F585A|nr:uncharacterized protein LOC129310037 isoform X2 [Prosopis cineraria]
MGKGLSKLETSLVSGSDCEPSEETSHLEFPSSDSELDWDSLTDHVHSDKEVPRLPNTENRDQSAANLSIKCMETWQNEIPGEFPRQSWSTPSSHPHHSCQQNAHTHVDMLHEDSLHYEYNQRFSFSNRRGNPQSRHKYRHHANQDLPGSSMGFSYYDDRYLHYPAEAISMAIPSSFPKFQKHVAEQNPPPTASPTPPPPQVSTWGFSYLFDLNDDNYYENIHLSYGHNTRSNSSDCDVREIREREGIPDLEYEAEQGSKDSGFDEKGLKRGNLNSGDGTSNAAQLSSRTDAFFDEERTPKDRDSNTEKEIKANTEIVASKNLEPGIREGFASLVLGLIFPSVVKCSHPPPRILSNLLAHKGQLSCSTEKTNNQGRVSAMFGDLSSALELLCLWEKRLYKEVMGEEKLRILYEKRYKRLIDLDGHGAESDEINDSWASVRHMQTEISVAVASISVVSREIERLRDDKLLPELNKLIEGLIKLWKYMGTCHQKQVQIIMKAKSHIHILDPSRNRSNPRATSRLETVILNWGICFSNFVKTQKDFVKSLNEWLLRCMLPEPEKTVNGTDSFSPSRIGAPPVFNLCNDWYHTIDSISEIGVSNAFSNFASGLHHLYEKQKEEQAQKARVDNLLWDYEDGLKSLHKKNHVSFHRDFSSIMAALEDDVEAEVPLLEGFDESLKLLGKRLLEQRARHTEVIRQVNDTASSCLQVGLSPIFEVLECYCFEHLKAYELLRLPNAASHE